jgi:3-hydroxyacyl-CoA dehydrogenase/3a,7a,12a-trihydroxy-5b-cholest-24-enoyl-CoA hydratase
MHGKGFTALPTYAVIPALTGVMKRSATATWPPASTTASTACCTASSYTELRRPLPPKAKLSHRTWVKDIFDKGKNAFVVIAVETTDETGEVLAYNELGSVIRGAGGWGGDRGPSSDVNTPPDRAPDFTKTEKIGDNQALLYRLSGDWNPLHVDPGFASAFGFSKPILHGLCTFGYAARHVLRALRHRPAQVQEHQGALRRQRVPRRDPRHRDLEGVGDPRVLRCKVKERDKVVLSHAAVEFYKEVPNTAPKAKPAAAATAAAPAMPNSADVFTAIGQFLQKHPAERPPRPTRCSSSS